MRKRFGYSFYYLIMGLLALVMFYPFLFAILASFESKEQLIAIGSLLIIPKEFTFDAYKSSFSPLLLRTTFNTVMRTLWFTGIITFASCLCGYVINRVDFKGKKVFYVYTLFMQMVPAALLLVPNYIMASRIPFIGGNNWLGQGGHGMINHPLVLYVIVQSGFMIWIIFFAMSMDTVPKALEEAACIDGAGFFRTIFRVVLPLQKPIIAVIAINTAIAAWNDFLGPFTYINDVQFNTLQGYLAQLVDRLSSFGDRDYPQIFALSAITTIPVLIMFLFMQKYIIQGIASAGIKG